MPANLQEAINWLIGEIEGDATVNSLGVTAAYMYSAPEVGTDAYPFVIIGKQAGSHTLTLCGAAYDVHYLAIKCVDYGFDGGERARDVVDAIRKLIEFRKAPLTGGEILSITPNNSYEYDEQESGNNNFFHCVISEKVIVG
jgi:hypothetical protein